MTLVPETKPEEPSSCTEINAVVPSEAEFSTATVKSSAKMPATSLAAANKFTRKRGSTGKRKKEVARSSFQKQQTSVRERRKSNEGKNNQAKGRKRRRSSETSTKVQLDERDEESEAETDESWNSEDDPDRLWCICKKPHNNCFMICCDSCEDWFHGKCVGVTKNMGKQMELNGVEWVCPNCSKKKEIEEKEREAQKLAKSSKEKEVKKTATKQSLQKETVKNLKENSNDDVSATFSPVQKPKASTTINGKSNCLICKNEAQPGSMYCSEACIVKHNQEPVYGYPERKSSSEIQVTHGIESSVSIQPQVLEQSEDVSSLVASTTTELPRPNTDNRICMSHLAGSEDPTVENVKTLLCNHPASFQMRPDVAAAAATAAMFHIHNTERRQTHMQDEEMPALQSNLISFQSRSTVQPVETVTMERVPIPTPTITNNAHLVQLAESATSPIVSSVIVSRDDAVSRIVFKVDHGVQYPNGTTVGNTTILDENLLNDGKRTAEMKKTETLEVKTEEENNVSDREPSSTVKIRIPEINYDGSPSLGSVVMDRLVGACATVWKGYVNIPDVARFFTTVQVVSGDSQNLCRDLPDTVDIVGRIIPEIAWDYISKMKRCVTKEILVLRLTAANDEEKIPYIALFTYLNIKNSIGVVGNVSKMIKDFYIMPLASNKPVPQVLLPLNGPGFEDFRPHLLLGILVRTRRKRPPSEPSFMVKIPKYFSPPEATERSYTPPLPVTGTHTPPYPPPALIVSRGNNIDNYTH